MKRDDRRNARGGESPESLGVIGEVGPKGWWRGGVGVYATRWQSRVNGHGLLQSNGTKMPASATGAELNNQPAMRFDGVDDVMVFDGAASEWSFLHNGQGFTLFAAGTPRLSGNYTWVATMSTAGGSGLWFRVAGAPNQIYPWVYNGLTNVVNGTPTHATIADDLSLILDYSYGTSATPDYDLRTSGITRYSGSQLTAPDAGASSANFAIGGFSDGGGFGKFDLGDLIIFDRVLAIEERAAVYGEVAARYTTP